MWLLYKNSSYSWMPNTLLLDWWLYFAFYYPTTPTAYPSITGGRSVGHTVALTLIFVGITNFWALPLSELCGYSTPLTNFLVTKEFSLHRPVLILRPTLNYRDIDNQSKQCQNHSSKLGKTHIYCVSAYKYRCLWSGLGGGGVTFWLLNENLTFKGPAA
jgi:hypothetical protein